MTQWNVLSAHRRLTEYLEKRGVDEPRLAAEILIAHALGIQRIHIYTSFERVLTEQEVAALGALGKRLAHGEPIQLVTGDTAFLAHTFRVRPGVFIPRPETEILADYCIRRIAAMESAWFVDVGAGAGVLAVSLLKAAPQARGVAVDISPDAAALTRENAEALEVADRLVCAAGDLLAPVARSDMQFDAIVSNPPYIPSGDINSLDTIVRDHDPRIALDGGPDGLDVVRRLASDSLPLLKPCGFLAIEIGIGQAAAASEILRNVGFEPIFIEKDLAGIERMVAGEKP